MIAKGTTHNNGAKLAAYMTTGKDGERAELWELRGFEATNIKDALRDVQIMAGATKAEQPFFHVQVRNREGETLTRQQFEYAADRIERMLGLTGQPRAISFHTYEHNNDQHMHVAWSRIDQDTMTAKPLPFFKERLKKISRELELHFGLEPVTNERKGSIKFAPTRAQEEQARRVGVDVHEVRNAIRNCWDRSDCGTSFQAALEHEGFTLAQGERRDFVVIDHGGGVHALGKRILDMTAAKIRTRLSDLEATSLPNMEQARDFLRGASRERAQEQPDIKERLKQELTEVDRILYGPSLADLRSELSEVQKLISKAERSQQQGKPEPAWDRDHDDRVWHDAVVNAAIEKEKVAREFVEPGERETRAGDRQAGAGNRKKEWSAIPPIPEPIRTSPEFHFADAGREAGRDQNYTPPKELKGMSDRIMNYVQTLWNDPAQIAAKGKTLSAVLDHEGIALAQVTKEESDRSHREAQFAKAIGNYAPRFREGEIVAVTEPTLEYRRNGEIMGAAPRVHKLDQKAAEIFIAEIDKPRQVRGIDATKRALDERAAQRASDREATRLENATNIIDRSRTIANDNIRRTAKVGKIAVRTIGKTLDAVSNAFESLFAPALTPEQIRLGERAAYRREAEAESTIDFAKYTADFAQQRQQQENDREAERQRHRDGGGRER
jgi:hypothetical protein